MVISSRLACPLPSLISDATSSKQKDTHVQAGIRLVFLCVDASELDTARTRTRASHEIRGVLNRARFHSWFGCSFGILRVNSCRRDQHLHLVSKRENRAKSDSYQ